MIDNQHTPNRKRRTLFLLIFCLTVFLFSSLTGVYLLFLAPATGTVPALIIEPKEYDFGCVAEGDKYVTSFRLRNTSLHPITILHAVGGCSCTTTSFRETLIPSGKTVVMMCTLDTTGKSDIFRGAIFIGYVLQDISSINDETTVTPLYTVIDLRATVTTGNL